MTIERKRRAKRWIKDLIGNYPLLDEKTVQAQNLLRDRLLKARILKEINYLYSFEVFPLFSHIYIETINRCNGSCSFCQVNRFCDTREFKRMDQELFVKIIKQLRELEYKKIVYLHSNNEPLLDNRIYEFAKIARENLIFAKLSLWTNGTLLNIDRFKELMKYLDVMVIDNYNDRLELNKPVREIVEYCKDNSVYLKKVKIKVRRETEKLANRASLSPNRDKIKPFKSSCLLPFKQFVIRPDGKVSLCCNDAFGDVTLGDLTHQSLVDIWYGEEFKQIRRKILKGRHTINICYGCDILHNPMPGQKVFHPPLHLLNKTD